MQEVSGSSPLSSTGQKRNSKDSNSEYSRKVQQRRLGGAAVRVFGSAFPRLWVLPDVGFQVLNRRWPTCDLGNSPCHRSRGSCRRVTTGSPGGLFLPATVVAFASSPAALAVLVVRVYSQGAAPAGEGREFADGTLGAWDRVSRRWCPSGAGALGPVPFRCRDAPWRSPARLPARAGAPLEEPGDAAQRT
jgi:hypothetical protein